MKSTFLVLATLCSLSQLNAQKVKLGVKGGVNLSQMTLRTSDDLQYTGGDAAFHIGPFAHIALADNFAFQPAVLFNNRGASIESFKFKSINVDVPLNLVFTEGNFFVGAGPNISYGISGKVKSGAEKVDMYDKDKAQTLTHKRLDVGINGIMGYTFAGGFCVSSFFTGGIADIYEGNGDVAGISTRTRSFGLSLGYVFPNGKKTGKR